MNRCKKKVGFTLVELMVSLFIVGIVMMGWWRIMNATSPYREAQRRAAVEIAAGVLDVFTPPTKESVYWKIDPSGNITEDTTQLRFRFPSGWLPAESPVRYSLKTQSVLANAPSVESWSPSGVGGTRWWARIDLFDGEDASSHPSPFATFEQLICIQ